MHSLTKTPSLVAKFYVPSLLDSILSLLTSPLTREPTGLSAVEQLLVVKLLFK
jgi:hypothetical protein